MSILYFSSPYVLASAVVGTVLLYKLILCPIFLSPLSKVPAAHPLARVTHLWIEWHRFRGTDFRRICEGFASKGPYIRLGPNEMAVNCIEGVQSAYGAGVNNFFKDKSYEYFVNHGHHNMSSSTGNEHEVRRRRVAGVYTKSFLQSSPHVQTILRTILLQRLLPLFAQAQSSEKGSINILPILQSYALDFVSSFTFGLSRGLNLLQDESLREHWFDLYNRGYPSASMFWLLEYPLLTKVLCAVGVPLLSAGHFEAHKEYNEWASRQVMEAEVAIWKIMSGDRAFVDGELPVLYQAVRSGIARDLDAEEDFVPDEYQLLELASECFDHLVSARDAFGTAFTYIIYEISRHPQSQADLRNELLSLETPLSYNPTNPSQTTLPSPSILEHLPFLNAVIKEGLRLRNNTPGFDPRVTPADRESSIGPYGKLPPGIRVGAYAWCLHRREDVFPDARTWNPRRWMDGKDGAGIAQWSFAFSGGSRGCVGQQTTMELMRFAVAGIYTNFKTSVADESEYPGTDEFVSHACSEQLFIRFEPLS